MTLLLFLINLLILQPLIEKTPLSGPGELKTKRGRKRRKDDAESMTDSLENEYQGNLYDKEK